MTVDFRFALDESVIIKAIKARAVIDAATYSHSGCEYRVNYWMEGCRRQDWLREYELSEDK